jgi:hypothetical protein
VEPSATASDAALAAVGATSSAVGAAIAAIAAAATAAFSIAATITVSAAAIAATLWLIFVCPCRCLCFCLPPLLPTLAVTTVVCRRHCHFCRRRNRCPCSFHHQRCHCCLFFCCWLRCLYVSTAAAFVSIAVACHRFCFRLRHATASISETINTVVYATAAITDEKR